MTRKDENNKKLVAVKVASIYAVFSILWILFSDQAVYFLIKDAAIITEIQTIKGWFFVIISSLLIFFLLLREISKHSYIGAVLRQSETILSSITDAAQDGVLMITPRGKLCFWNPAAQRIFGYNQEEALGRDLHILLAPDRYHEAYKKAFSLFQHDGKGTAVGNTLELHGNHKDGREIPIELSLSAIELKDGWHAVGLVRDITKRKQAEEGLRASEKKYRTFFENSCDAMVMIRDGLFIDCNPAMVTMLGYQYVDEIIDLSPVQISPEYQSDGNSSSEKEKEMLALAYSQGTHRFEWDYRKKNGDVFPVEVSLTAIPSDEGMMLLAVWRDIKDRKIAEGALQDSKRKLNAIFDHHYQLTGLIDNTGRLIAANRTALRFARTEETEVIGQYFWDGPWWEQSQRSELQEKVERATKGEFVRFETTHPTADGQVRNIDFSLSPVWDNDGEVIYVVPEGRDITEVKQAEHDKVKLQEQLSQAQKMEAMGTLAGGVAHDFNNILSAIIGYTELSKWSLGNTQQLTEYLDNILKAGERAKDLIQQILTFSRQTEKDKKPVSVKFIAKEALKLIRASLPTTIEIEQRLESDSLVMSDPTEIHQIVMNLCTNAGHSMREEGGILMVDLTDVHLSPDYTSLYPNLEPGPYLKLTVSDAGCGMSPDILDRAFDPFFTTKEQGEGTGMGLSVVHGIVESCGGIIRAHSELGKGSRFELFFPVTSSTNVRTKENKEAEAPRGTETILFVDDEPAIIEIGHTILEKLGYRVTTANNALEALEVFRSNPDGIELVITDMTMPKMTGNRLAKELVSIRSDIPIIICSGFSTGLIKEKALSMGIKGFLMKPIIFKEIAVLVRQVLDEAKRNNQG